MSLSDSFDHWCFAEYETGAAGMALYRVVFGVYLAVAILGWPGSRTWLAEVPDAAYLPPPGPMQLFGGFPSTSVIWGLEAALLVGAVMLIAGLGRRWLVVALGVGLLTYDGFLFATGKIDHGTHLVTMLPLVLAWAPGFGVPAGADAVSTHADSPLVDGRGWPKALLALLVGFAMFTAGAEKLVWGWLSPGDQAIQNFLYQNAEVYGRSGLLTEVVQGTIPWYIWEGLDWTTVIFEIGFLFAVVSRRWFRGFCVAAVFFHLGVFLILSISFLHQLIVYAAFLDWDRLASREGVARWRNRLQAWWQGPWWRSAVAVTSVVAMLAGSKVFVDRVLRGIYIKDDALFGYIAFGVGVAVALAAAGRAMMSFLRAEQGSSDMRVEDGE